MSKTAKPKPVATDPAAKKVREALASEVAPEASNPAAVVEVTKPDPIAEAIAAGAAAAKQEQEARASAFHQQYLELMQRMNCRHQPILLMGFDGSVNWQLRPVALPPAG